MKPFGAAVSASSVGERHRRRLEQAQRGRLGLAVAADRRDLVLSGAEQDDLATDAHEVQRAVRCRGFSCAIDSSASPDSAVSSLLALTCLSTQWRP